MNKIFFTEHLLLDPALLCSSSSSSNNTAANTGVSQYYFCYSTPVKDTDYDTHTVLQTSLQYSRLLHVHLVIVNIKQLLEWNGLHCPEML